LFMSKTNTYFELMEALRQPGCPICRMADLAVRKHIDVFFYEQLNALERRAEIREARGYCSFHGAMLPAPGRMTGVAVVHADVLGAALRELNAVLPPRGMSVGAQTGSAIRQTARRAREAARPRRGCALCDYERERETMYLDTLVREMRDKELLEAFKASSGVCLPHFGAALALSDIAPVSMATFLEIERGHLQKLKDELDEYLHKVNASYDAEQMGAEGDAPIRAARMLSGRVVHTDGRW